MVDDLRVEIAHKTEELEKQAEIIKKYETVFAQSSASIAARDAELAALA
jgi:hypothetical protein